MKGKAEAISLNNSGFSFTLVLNNLFSFPTIANTEKELNVYNDNHQIVYLEQSYFFLSSAQGYRANPRWELASEPGGLEPEPACIPKLYATPGIGDGGQT